MKLNMNSLRVKLTLIFIMLVVFSAVGIASVLYNTMAKALQDGFYSKLEVVADSRANHIADYISRDITAVSALAKGNKIREEFQKTNPSLETLQYVVEGDAKRFPVFSEIMIMDTDGKILASNDKGHLGIDRSEDEYFKGAITGKPYFKNIYKSSITGKVGYVVASPIFQAGTNKIMGVIAARGDLAHINKIVEDDTGLGKTGDMYLVNDDGLMITATRLGRDEMLLKKIDNEGIRQAFSGKDVTGVFKDYRGQEVLGRYYIDKDITDVTAKKICVAAEIDAVEAFSPLYQARNFSIFLTLIFIILAVLVGPLVANKIAKPLEELSEVAKKVSGGDLTPEVIVKGNDEISVLARSFKSMLENLKNILTKTKDAVNQITSAANEILAASQQQASGAREQSAAVSEITSSSKELAKSSEQVGETIRRVSEVAAHALIGMNKIKDAIGKSNQIISSLSEKSQKIGKITEVIDDVADQTNLLAVNAAIEAARAGEEGKGFTVVADEIRKLADSTAKSTKDITALIELIQHEMSGVIIAMESSVSSVDEETKLSQESAERAKEISMNATQQISGTKQISDAMINIDEAMKQIAASAQQSQVAVKQMTGLAKELKDIAEKFKLA